MDFTLSDEQEFFVDAVHSLLAKRSGSSAVRQAFAAEPGFDTALWETLAAEIGAAGLLVPDELGGAGATSLEAHLVLEELGYALAPTPFLGSAVVATRAISLADSEAAPRLLPALADGTSIGALAWADRAGHWRLDGSDIAAHDGRLHGTSTLVLDGLAADVLLAVAVQGGRVGVWEVLGGTGLTRVRTPALDPTLRFARLEFDGTPARPLTTDASRILPRLRAEALAAVAAWQVGTARRGLDMTVGHAKQRSQFGRPIGSFQALKHRLADLSVAVETAETLARVASWRVGSDGEAGAETAMAKSVASDALGLVAAETVQLHGGIGITWEHDAQLVFKRAHATRELFGSPERLRAELFAERFARG